MLKLTVPGVELFDDSTQQFHYTRDTILELEHSLFSLSKWEAKWEKPFFSPQPKSEEETLDYIYQMCLTPDIPVEIFNRIDDRLMSIVNEYLSAKQTATWFNERPSGSPNNTSRETITSELIYYWMMTHRISLECEHWHLNRLITLLKVFEQKNSPPKKMNKADAAAERNRINAQRKAAMKTSG